MGRRARELAYLSQAKRNPPSSPRQKEGELPHLKEWSTILDISDPREAFYQTLSGHEFKCPKCGGILKQQNKSYLIGNYDGEDELESTVTGGSFGWFCTTCPVVVFNRPELRDFLHHLPSDLEIGPNAIILGIINMNAIPVQKRGMPIGKPENPIPLCIFTNLPPLPPESKLF
jgi:hypothetical protein